MATLTLNKLNNWVTGRGKLSYDPHRPGLKDTDRTGRSNRTVWWCVVEVNDETDRYYRWMLDKHWWQGNEKGDVLAIDGKKYDIKAPSWGSHISVVRGERPGSGVVAEQNAKGAEAQAIYDLYEARWKIRDHKTTTFQYQISPYKAVQGPTEFWALRVKSQELNEIRELLGLKIYDHYHMTIGRKELD